MSCRLGKLRGKMSKEQGLLSWCFCCPHRLEFEAGQGLDLKCLLKLWGLVTSLPCPCSPCAPGPGSSLKLTPVE